MLHFILIAALAGFGSGSGTGTGGGGGSQFVGVYDGGSGAIQTAAAKVVIDAAGDSSQAGYSKSTQVELTGSGAAGGVVFGDTTQLMSAGNPENGLQGLAPSGQQYCALSGAQLNGVILHFCAGEYNGSTLTPDVGPPPSGYPSATVVTGPSGHYATGLLGNGSNWQFTWTGTNNPAAFAWDAGFTFFETFTAQPANGESVTDFGGLTTGGNDFLLFATQLPSQDGLFDMGSSAPLPDGGSQVFTAANTAVNVYQSNAVTGYCAGIGPDGGVGIVKICGHNVQATLTQVHAPPYAFGGTMASTLGIGDRVSVHEVAISNIPATEGYCTQLCRDATEQPTFLDSIGDSITAGSSLDPKNIAYPTQIQTYAGSTVAVTDRGVPGVLASYCYGNEWEEYRYASTGIATWMCGTNDLVTGTAPSVVEGYTQSFVNEAIADGVRVILYTLIPNATAYDAGYLNNYIAYNAWLMGAPDGGLPRQPNVSVIDSYGLFSDPTRPGTGVSGYYDQSGIHPTFLGSYVLANVGWQSVAEGNVLWSQYADGGAGVPIPSVAYSVTLLGTPQSGNAVLTLRPDGGLVLLVNDGGAYTLSTTAGG